MSDEAKALNRIADAIERQAEAIILLAQATAGEFDQEDEPAPGQSLSDVPGGRGMGMGRWAHST